MSTIISDQSPHRNSSTQLIAESFLSGQGLPMANVLSADTILAIFKKHDSLFGENNGAVFNTAITL